MMMLLVVVQDNYVVVYELLDEMLDNGFPLATEANILKEMIKPPNILRTVVNSVTGTSVADPGCLSQIRIFPSRIQSQKDSGSRIQIRIKEFKYF
jgi:AP-3 complex subunit mu